MHRKLAHQGYQDIHLYNQGESEMCISLHTIHEIHNINDEIPGARYDNLFKNVPIQKWDIKLPQPSVHHPRVPELRFQQIEDHI